MDNHDEQHSTPKPIDYPIQDEAPPVLPDPLPPVTPASPIINASVLFPERELFGAKKNSPLREKNINKPMPFTREWHGFG